MICCKVGKSPPSQRVLLDNRQHRGSISIHVFQPASIYTCLNLHMPATPHWKMLPNVASDGGPSAYNGAFQIRRDHISRVLYLVFHCFILISMNVTNQCRVEMCRSEHTRICSHIGYSGWRPTWTMRHSFKQCSRRCIQLTHWAHFDFFFCFGWLLSLQGTTMSL